MRGVKVFTIIIFSCFQAYSQEETFVTTPNQMMSFLNPSMTGFDDLSVSYFQQVRSSKDFLVMAEFAIKSEQSTYHLRSLRKEDTYEFERYESKKGFINRKGNRHGLGIIGAQQKSGIFEHGVVKASYSRHLAISQTLNISVGSAFGVSNTSMSSENLSERNLTLDGGLTVYGKSFFVGYSARNIVYRPTGENLRLEGFEGLKQQRLMLGMRHYLSYPFISETFVSLYQKEREGSRLEIGASIEYDELLSLALYINDSQSVAGQIGFRIYNNLQIFYTFDTQKHVADSRQEFHVLMRRNK